MATKDTTKPDLKTMKTSVTPTEQMVIKLAANLVGKTVGNYMKDLVLAQAEKDVKASGVDMDKLRKKLA